MQMLLLRIDIASLGFEAALNFISSNENKRLAEQRLLQLVPDSLHFFVANVAEDIVASDAVKLKEVVSLVAGSSELLRHTLHCDETRSMG